jgi:hypothetical protein
MGGLLRLGVKIKEFGERAAHRRKRWAGAVIALGLAVRDFAGRFPARGK